MAEIDERNMIAQAAAGDPEAFSVLYERYVTRIYNYVFYRTGNTAEAEDLTAKVFHRALGAVHTYQDMGLPFSAWLYRIAHNLIANWHRDNSRRNEVPLEDHETLHVKTDHPEASLEKDQEQEWLLHAIRKLPPERQQLIILKFVERMSNAEVAVIMNRSEGAIKSLYHRTLLSLREELEHGEKE